jgi:hypothetical protein
MKVQKSAEIFGKGRTRVDTVSRQYRLLARVKVKQQVDQCIQDKQKFGNNVTVSETNVMKKV